MSPHAGNGQPSYELELRAAEQRKRLHSTVEELKSRVHETLDTKNIAREYVRPVAIVAGVISLVIGYAFAGIFTRH
jgi:hypothetical protein